jgi:hypothetical protein
MALASRFAAGKALPTGKGITLGKPSIGAGLLSQALGPQSVAAPAAAGVPDVQVNPSVLPPDAGYEASVAALQQNRDQTQAQLANQKQQGLLNYGYDYVNGTLTYDPKNPYSQAAMLKRQFDQAQAGNTTSYAARGQLYAGSLQNAQNNTAFQSGQANDALMKNLQAFIAKNAGDQASTLTNYELGLGQAEGARLDRASSNPLYQPSAAPEAAAPLQDTNTAAAPFKTLPWKDSAGHPGVLHIYPDGRRVFVRS